jgi:uncharacterized protein YfbU (UPF0304 family)
MFYRDILKKLNLKKFSSPFDALYLTKIKEIIDIFENKINYKELINTEDMDYNPIMNNLNKIYGYRSIYKKFNNYNLSDIQQLYHGVTFAHHNLKDDKVIEHFDRCFKRLDIIKKKRIKCLFCLFLFPNYHSKYSPYKEITKKIIYIRKIFNR